MKYDKAKFCDESGKRVTVGLFEEYDRPDRKFRPIAKLSDWKEKYINTMDPSEYTAAMELVGDWAHWKQIRNHPYLKATFDEWLEEMKVKIQSDAYMKLHWQASQPGGSAAARWLAERGAGLGTQAKRGRPSSKEHPLPPEADEFEDALRLGLTQGVQGVTNAVHD